jgi:WD40 repeat protein
MTSIKTIFTVGCLWPAGILLGGLVLYGLSNTLEGHFAGMGDCDRSAGCLYALSDDSRGVRVIGFSANGDRILVQGQRGGRIYDASNGRILQRLNLGNGPWKYSVTGDRSQIVASRKDLVKVLNWNGQVQHSWAPAADTSVRAVAMLPILNGFFVADSEGLAVHHQNGNLVTRIPVEGSFLDVTATPTGEYIAAYDFVGDTLNVWPLQRFSAGIRIPDIVASTQSIHLSADGALVAAGGEPGAYVWQTNNGQVVLAVEASDVAVTATALSQDGRQFATGFEDGRVKVFDVATQTPIQQFDHNRVPRKLGFDQGGERLAVELEHNVRISGGERILRRQDRDREANRPTPVLRQSDNRISTSPGYAIVWELTPTSP